MLPKKRFRHSYRQQKQKGVHCSDRPYYLEKFALPPLTGWLPAMALVTIQEISTGFPATYHTQMLMA